jgi:DnaK suppressor protein
MAAKKKPVVKNNTKSKQAAAPTKKPAEKAASRAKPVKGAASSAKDKKVPAPKLPTAKVAAKKTPAKKAGTETRKASAKESPAISKDTIKPLKEPAVKETAAKESTGKESAAKESVVKEPGKRKTETAKVIAVATMPTNVAPVESGKTLKKGASNKLKVKPDVSSKPQNTDKKTIVPKSTARLVDAHEPAFNLSTGPIHGIPPYQPKPGEEYMSEGQLEHFSRILNNWKRELMEEVDRTIHHLRDEATNFPDPNDRATQESEFGLELRARDRERKLLKKIDAALERIEDGSYGYCEETGEEIGLRRLEARPIATLCLEAQERHELVERHYGEREDRYR